MSNQHEEAVERIDARLCVVEGKLDGVASMLNEMKVREDERAKMRAETMAKLRGVALVGGLLSIFVGTIWKIFEALHG